MANFIKKCSFVKKTVKAGFTLIEMIVVLAIFGILTTIIVFNYGEFNSNIILTNTAYEVALQTREAQFFGLGARGVNVGTGNDFRTAYGIFVNLDDGSSEDGKTKNIILFNDKVDNLICDGINGTNCTCSGDIEDECVEKLTTNRRIVISKITGVYQPGDCNSNIEKLSVLFKRPDPGAIMVNAFNEDTAGSEKFIQVLIEFEAPNIQNKQYVVINDIGQISVMNSAEASEEVGPNCVI